MGRNCFPVAVVVHHSDGGLATGQQVRPCAAINLVILHVLAGMAVAPELRCKSRGGGPKLQLHLRITFVWQISSVIDDASPRSGRLVTSSAYSETKDSGGGAAE